METVGIGSVKVTPVWAAGRACLAARVAVRINQDFAQSPAACL
jgi:hypothetical protein